MNQQTSGKSFDDALWAAWKDGHNRACQINWCNHKYQRTMFEAWRAEWSRVHEIGKIEK